MPSFADWVKNELGLWTTGDGAELALEQGGVSVKARTGQTADTIPYIDGAGELHAPVLASNPSVAGPTWTTAGYTRRIWVKDTEGVIQLGQASVDGTTYGILERNGELWFVSADGDDDTATRTFLGKFSNGKFVVGSDVLNPTEHYFGGNVAFLNDIRVNGHINVQGTIGTAGPTFVSGKGYYYTLGDLLLQWFYMNPAGSTGTWTYPTAFRTGTTPSVQATISSGGGNPVSIDVYNITGTSCDYEQQEYSLGWGAGGANISFFAIGLAP